MDNRVYYGEYSLQHWIDLILKRNIILPEYQRFFVWEEQQVEKLIDTFKQRQFVPPVTIGAFKSGSGNQNLLLDGQQRLTSILVAYLGIYPEKDGHKGTIETFANDNDDISDDEQPDNIIDWTFRKLVEKGRSKEEILTKDNKSYKNKDFGLAPDFFKTHFLGFSYLVPSSTSQTVQQNYYSSVFRNINNQGEPLLAQESRQALYFLGEGLVPFFKPKFFDVFESKSSGKADFVRYLSLLSQFYKDKTTGSIAKGFKLKMESYYEDYIHSIIADRDEKFGKFSTTFPQKNYQDRFANFEAALIALNIPKSFPSIIDLDMYMFGLIHEVVFLNKSVDIQQVDALKAEINAKIADLKLEPSHTKTPGALKHLRARIESSTSIFKKYEQR